MDVVWHDTVGLQHIPAARPKIQEHIARSRCRYWVFEHRAPLARLERHKI